MLGALERGSPIIPSARSCLGATRKLELAHVLDSEWRRRESLLPPSCLLGSHSRTDRRGRSAPDLSAGRGSRVLLILLQVRPHQPFPEVRLKLRLRLFEGRPQSNCSHRRGRPGRSYGYSSACPACGAQINVLDDGSLPQRRPLAAAIDRRPIDRNSAVEAIQIHPGSTLLVINLQT